jgi:hypothetical protein
MRLGPKTFPSSFQIQPNDGLSTILCPTCFAKLKMFNDYRQKAVQSDASMKKFLSNIKTATIQQFNETFETKMEANEDLELREFEEHFPDKLDHTVNRPRTRANSLSSLISYQSEPEVPRNVCPSVMELTDYEAEQQNDEEEEVGMEEIETEETKTDDYMENRNQFENEDFSNVKTDVAVYQQPEEQETFKVPETPSVAEMSSDLDTSRNLCLKCNKQFSTKTSRFL